MTAQPRGERDRMYEIARRIEARFEPIDGILAQAPKADGSRIRDILDKALECKGLELDEAAALATALRPDDAEALFAAAATVKHRIYGDRVVLFSPLYITNECRGGCVYCPFRAENTKLKRSTLTAEQVSESVRQLLRTGQKRLLLVFGDGDCATPEYMAQTVAAVYRTREPNGEIRRVNVNAAPLTEEGFRTLAPAGLGTFQVFQETYHRPTYEVMHPYGPKADYNWRLSVWDRCFPSGIDDMGLGALFGLYDWRWDLLALLAHARYLDDTFGVGPHTISVPRIEPAADTPLSMNPPAQVTDDSFRKLVAIIRLALPYTGIILTTRETPAMRSECLHLGVSQMSAASRTTVGAGAFDEDPDDGQFEVSDHRSLDQVVRELCESGYIPSFCTACYRSGRTGEHFMELAKPGEIHHWCLPNALLTLKEYLIDHASEETRTAGERALAERLSWIDDAQERERIETRLKRLESGERDLYV